MTLFDIAAGLALVVSTLAGWIRGGTREIAWAGAFVLAAAAAILALRFTGPIARRAIHTPWMANIAAILIVFLAVYVLVRVIAASITRGIRKTTALGGLDRLVGAAIGLARGLVALGAAALVIGAIIPPERMPGWISGAALYPLSVESGRMLKKVAPEGARLAHDAAPVIGHAVREGDDTGADENRRYNGGDNGARPAPAGMRVETSP